jgi:hypothetical protein
MAVNAAEPAPAAKPSKKKDKKGKKDMSSLFAALGEDGEAPAAGAAQLNRQGHKQGVQSGEAVSAVQNSYGEAAVGAAAAHRQRRTGTCRQA